MFDRIGRRISDRTLKWLFLTPTFVFVLFIVVFPLIWSLGLSFCQYNATRTDPPDFIGLDNYRKVLSSREVWGRFAITGRYVALAVTGEFLLGFALALLLNKRFYGKGIITTLFLLPMMFSPVVIGTFFRFILDPNWGIVGHVLNGLFGIKKIAWTSDPKYAIYSLVICDIWIWTPFMLLMSLAGLSTVPKYLYEAAQIDRASWWFGFRYITLPHILPLLIIGLLFRSMDALRFFDKVYVMTGGGPGEMTQTVPYYIYKVAFSYWRTGESCALAYILVIMIIGLSSIYIHYLKRFSGR